MVDSSRNSILASLLVHLPIRVGASGSLFVSFWLDGRSFAPIRSRPKSRSRGRSLKLKTSELNSGYAFCFLLFSKKFTRRNDDKFIPIGEKSG
jgi:hypothetical protein